MQSRSDSNFKGIDISTWQKGINLNKLKERVYEVCIYCNTNYARNVLDSRLGKYSLWVAHYGVNKPGDNPIWDK